MRALLVINVCVVAPVFFFFWGGGGGGDCGI